MDNKYVSVHYNRHKKNFTIREYIKGVGWRKSGESACVYLGDVTFKVGQASRMRAIREKKRNVHAYAYGTLLQDKFEYPQILFGAAKIRYNPFGAYETFVDEKGEPVSKAALVMFDNEHGAQAWGVVH